MQDCRSGPGDWYWIPSRAIPAPNDVEPITEFPFFTFLYADLHAHMIALPITILVLGWIMGTILGKGQYRRRERLNEAAEPWRSFVHRGDGGGGTASYKYMGFPGIPHLKFAWHHLREFPLEEESGRVSGRIFPVLKTFGLRLIAELAILGGLSMLLYQPYTYWYGAGYNAVELWKGNAYPVLVIHHTLGRIPVLYHCLDER